VEAAVGVCQDFRAIVTANSRLHNARPPFACPCSYTPAARAVTPTLTHAHHTTHGHHVGLTQLLTLPRFDEQASRDVVLDEDRRRARFVADSSSVTDMKRKQKKKWPARPLQAFTSLFLSSMKHTLTVAHYPLVYHNTAYVQRRRNAHASTVVHFLIESEPSTAPLHSSGPFSQSVSLITHLFVCVWHTQASTSACRWLARRRERGLIGRWRRLRPVSSPTGTCTRTARWSVTSTSLRLPISLSLILPSVLVTFNAHVD
jgi:hypothetical protein